MDIGTEQQALPQHVMITPAFPEKLPLSDWDAFRDQVQHQLDAFLIDSRASTEPSDGHDTEFWRALRGTLSGGKRTRPRLVHLAYRAFSGTDMAACARLGAAFELLHGALLVHDDIIDRDFFRRGRPNVSAVYRDHALGLGHPPMDADHAGHSAALIAGDILLAGSIRLSSLAALGSPDPAGVIDAMSAAVLRSASGELDDLLYSLQPRSTSIANVLNMERLKTAAYSFEAPLTAGALLAGSTARAAVDLGRIGRQIGVAYQITDDILGTFGDEQVTGKPVDSDLREGKQTILSAYAATVCDFDAHVEAYRRGSLDIEDLRDLLRTCGAEEYARNLAEDLVNAALSGLAEITVPPAIRIELAAMAHHAIKRRN